MEEGRKRRNLILKIISFESEPKYGRLPFRKSALLMTHSPVKGDLLRVLVMSLDGGYHTEDSNTSSPRVNGID